MLGDPPRLRFRVPGAAGVHSTAAGTPVTLWIPEVEGLLGLDGVALVLQYRVRDRAASYDSGVRELRLPLERVESVAVRRRWFRAPVAVVRARDLHLLAELPGARGAEVELQLERGELAAAQELASTVALWSAERALGEGAGSSGRLAP